MKIQKLFLKVQGILLLHGNYIVCPALDEICGELSCDPK